MPGSPAAADPRPIFIVGSNGSGSTLLRLMLDSHERIAIPAETGFLRLALTHRWVPYWQLGDRWHTGLGMSDEELTAALADFYGGLFASYAAKQGKPRWGDKTPFHVWHMQLAARMFPHCQFIGIVRHPGAVVSSQRRRFRRTYPQSARHWLRSVTQLVHEAMTLGEQCVVLRYEDLVQRPEQVARALLDWLGEPWSPTVLDHHGRAPGPGTPARAEGFTALDRPIDASAVSEWEHHLRGTQRRTVLAPTAALAGFLGYDWSRTLPLGDFGDGGSPLMTGTALSRRRADHGGSVDWSRRPRPGLADLPLRPPAPKRRRPRGLTLDEVRLRDVLQHRLAGGIDRWVPQRARERGNELRRAHPKLDRLLGPRH
jgi:Sulfotransferase family